MAPDEELVRKRAYAIWEAENRPHGREGMHWQEALRQIATEEAPTKPKRRVRKSVTPAPAVKRSRAKKTS